MSLEAAIQENTNALREFIALWSKMNLASEGRAAPPPTSKRTKAEPATAATAPASDESAQPKPQEKTEPVVDAAAKTAAIAVPEVNTAIIALAKAKGRDAAVAVLKQFGVAKVPELKAEQYADVIAAAKKAME